MLPLFRKEFDKYFKFHSGFTITSNEFFKLEGKWPLAFTIWKYEFNKDSHINELIVHDLTKFGKNNFNINWNDEKEIRKFYNNIIDKSLKVNFSSKRGEIRKTLPLLIYENGRAQKQGMQNFYRSINKDELGQLIISGFALKDDRHTRIKAPHGNVDGTCVGFMDDLSPVRLRTKKDVRYKKPGEGWIWFRLDTAMKDTNKSKCLNGPTDNRSYCAYDLDSAKATFTWFSITKAVNGVYPLWANQYDIWPPQLKPEFADYWYSLCFAFVLAENRCVITKFEKDNPVPGVTEIFVDNPMCPANPDSFWSKTLNDQIIDQPPVAKHLVEKIKELYTYWNFNYCKGQFIYSVGLQDEAYFKYFDYADFLTPYSGLIQIRKCAELNEKSDLLTRFSEISEQTKLVKAELYRMLVDEFNYFG